MEKIEVVTHNAQVVEAVIFVITGRGPDLLGRVILSKLKLNWSTVYKIKSDNRIAHNTSLPETLKLKYQQLFPDRIGKLEDFKAKIYVKKKKQRRNFIIPVKFLLLSKMLENRVMTIRR